MALPSSAKQKHLIFWPTNQLNLYSGLALPLPDTLKKSGILTIEDVRKRSDKDMMVTLFGEGRPYGLAKAGPRRRQPPRSTRKVSVKAFPTEITFNDRY